MEKNRTIIDYIHKLLSPAYVFNSCPSLALVIFLQHTSTNSIYDLLLFFTKKTHCSHHC